MISKQYLLVIFDFLMGYHFELLVSFPVIFLSFVLYDLFKNRKNESYQFNQKRFTLILMATFLPIHFKLTRDFIYLFRPRSNPYGNGQCFTEGKLPKHIPLKYLNFFESDHFTVEACTTYSAWMHKYVEKYLLDKDEKHWGISISPTLSLDHKFKVYQLKK